MIGRKVIIALSALCALALSAALVSPASAATAYTCSKEASVKDKFGAHCLTPTGSQKAEFGHIAFAGSTAISTTNANTASETTAASVSVLAGSLAGVATEIQCTGLSGAGELENKEVAGKMVAHATGVAVYTGCTVLKPAGKNCAVSGGKITSNELTGINEGAGTVAVKPASGETFASIKIESCTVAGLNNTFPVTGTLSRTVTGATSTTTEAGVTAQGTLKFGGNSAGLGSAETTKNSGSGIPLVST